MKVSAVSDGFSIDSTSHHGGRVPRKLASQLMETVWQECNINRAQNKYESSLTVYHFTLFLYLAIGSYMFYCLSVFWFHFCRRKFSAVTNGVCDEEIEKAAAWNFVEPYQRIQCSCSRYATNVWLSHAVKHLVIQNVIGINVPSFSFHWFSRHKNIRQRTSSTPGLPPSTGQVSQPPSKPKGVDKLEKAEKQQKRPLTPFHHRSPEDPSLETEGAGQRLVLPGQEDSHYPSLHHADVKAQTLHTSAGDLIGSPQPPPLSPHPTVQEEEATRQLKSSSTPHHQHWYTHPAEPRLLPQKSLDDSSLDLAMLDCPPSFPDSLEPTVYVGSAINPDEDTTHNPWRYFRLPGRKNANVQPPSLPVDKLRQDSSGCGGLDNIISVTE